ncbi:hypothetical protein [Blastopirellula marina]|uniref:Zinc-finger domain-containing protein n=1 Tax=Blastopirellula marina TaxID=124 RepID=A0A2S8FT47_9BACT|nr:hypothetical protein [Blastopirellula marina]PQO35353.1 hypothetical protein C5Y98_13365 [Blastopirellula marina]PTL43993.1 hypothetical protein C5Y97_13375 [Blastopirellula marina]
MISRSSSIHLKTCDEVFEILTGAPFPTGEAATDDAVERHLRCCHECRSLAEALRPATCELSESLPAEANRLPQVDGDFWRNADSLWSDPQAGRRQKNSQWLNLAVPLAAVLVAALSIGAYLGSHGNSAPGGGPGRSLADAKLDAERYLANLALPAVCQPLKASHSPEMVVQAAMTLDNSSLAHLTCCSECHHRGQDSQSAPAASSHAAVVAAANSCQACHAE